MEQKSPDAFGIGAFLFQHTFAPYVLALALGYGTILVSMEGIEKFGELPKIPDDIEIEIEGLNSGEVNLASAERLIERLDAQGNLTDADIKEAGDMITELENQIKFFEEERLSIPPKLTYAISELNRLIKNEPLSVRDLIEVKELEPEDVVVAEALEARRELEGHANP